MGWGRINRDVGARLPSFDFRDREFFSVVILSVIALHVLLCYGVGECLVKLHYGRGISDATQALLFLICCSRDVRFEFNGRHAEVGEPRIERCHAARFQFVQAQVALQREKLSERVGYRSAGGKGNATAVVRLLQVPGLDEHVEGALRAGRISKASDPAALSRKEQVFEFMRFVHRYLIDAKFLEGSHLVLRLVEQRFHALLHLFLLFLVLGGGARLLALSGARVRYRLLDLGNLLPNGRN